MIKPFKIVELVDRPDGLRVARFEVYRMDLSPNGKRVMNRMRAELLIPAGADPDQHLFQQLSSAGWF